jgi:hypothetical protein
MVETLLVSQVAPLVGDKKWSTYTQVGW